MSDFDTLLALTHAAESCNGAALQFIEDYSHVPEWSQFRNGTLCQPAADSQAGDRLRYVGLAADRLQRYVHDWDASYGGLRFIQEAVAAIPAWPIFKVNGRTYGTAHEAARASAGWIVEVYRDAEGWNDRETIADLAQRLTDASPIQDFAGYVEREHFAASPLAPLGDDYDTECERTADKKTDKFEGEEKKLPPPGVNECIRYIRKQTDLIKQGKRPTATKRALIAEHLGSSDTGAMERALRKDRYGWLLEASGQADK